MNFQKQIVAYVVLGVRVDECKRNRRGCRKRRNSRIGYTNRYMTANITKIEVVDGKDTDLHIDKPVYAIHLADVKE